MTTLLRLSGWWFLGLQEFSVFLSEVAVLLLLLLLVLVVGDSVVERSPNTPRSQSSD
jgi:hypothetical protein